MCYASELKISCTPTFSSALRSWIQAAVLIVENVNQRLTWPLLLFTPATSCILMPILVCHVMPMRREQRRPGPPEHWQQDRKVDYHTHRRLRNTHWTRKPNVGRNIRMKQPGGAHSGVMPRPVTFRLSTRRFLCGSLSGVDSFLMVPLIDAAR